MLLLMFLVIQLFNPSEAACPSGWTAGSMGGLSGCFYLVKSLLSDLRTWGMSERNCHQMDARSHLPYFTDNTPTSTTTFMNLCKTGTAMMFVTVTSAVWIGGFRDSGDGIIRRMNAYPFLTTGVWISGEPSGSVGNKDCVCYYLSQSGLRMCTCGTLGVRVCQISDETVPIPPENLHYTANRVTFTSATCPSTWTLIGKLYYQLPPATSYPNVAAAAAACASLDPRATLPYFTDITQWEAFLRVISTWQAVDNRNITIGAFQVQPGVYQMLDGAWLYSDWYNFGGQPSKAAGMNCVTLRDVDGYQWRSINCNTTAVYTVCQLNCTSAATTMTSTTTIPLLTSRSSTRLATIGTNTTIKAVTTVLVQTSVTAATNATIRPQTPTFSSSMVTNGTASTKPITRTTMLGGIKFSSSIMQTLTITSTQSSRITTVTTTATTMGISKSSSSLGSSRSSSNNNVSTTVPVQSPSVTMMPATISSIINGTGTSLSLSSMISTESAQSSPMTTVSTTRAASKSSTFSSSSRKEGTSGQSSTETSSTTLIGSSSLPTSRTLATDKVSTISPARAPTVLSTITNKDSSSGGPITSGILSVSKLSITAFPQTSALPTSVTMKTKFMDSTISSSLSTNATLVWSRVSNTSRAQDTSVATVNIIPTTSRSSSVSSSISANGSSTTTTALTTGPWTNTPKGSTSTITGTNYTTVNSKITTLVSTHKLSTVFLVNSIVNSTLINSCSYSSDTSATSVSSILLSIQGLSSVAPLVAARATSATGTTNKSSELSSGAVANGTSLTSKSTMGVTTQSSSVTNTIKAETRILNNSPASNRTWATDQAVATNSTQLATAKVMPVDSASPTTLGTKGAGTLGLTISSTSGSKSAVTQLFTTSAFSSNSIMSTLKPTIVNAAKTATSNLISSESTISTAIVSNDYERISTMANFSTASPTTSFNTNSNYANLRTTAAKTISASGTASTNAQTMWLTPSSKTVSSKVMTFSTVAGTSLVTSSLEVSGNRSLMLDSVSTNLSGTSTVSRPKAQTLAKSFTNMVPNKSSIVVMPIMQVVTGVGSSSQIGTTADSTRVVNLVSSTRKTINASSSSSNAGSIRFMTVGAPVTLLTNASWTSEVTTFPNSSAVSGQTTPPTLGLFNSTTLALAVTRSISTRSATLPASRQPAGQPKPVVFATTAAQTKLLTSPKSATLSMKSTTAAVSEQVSSEASTVFKLSPSQPSITSTSSDQTNATSSSPLSSWSQNLSSTFTSKSVAVTSPSSIGSKSGTSTGSSVLASKTLLSDNAAQLLQRSTYGYMGYVNLTSIVSRKFGIPGTTLGGNDESIYERLFSQ